MECVAGNTCHHSMQHLGVHRIIRQLVKLYSDPHALVLVLNTTNEVCEGMVLKIQV